LLNGNNITMLLGYKFCRFFFLAKMGPVFNRRLKLRMIPGGDPEEGDKGAA